MFSQVYYLLRSRLDGSYLVAHPDLGRNHPLESDVGYLLMFREHFDALAYLNQHSPRVSSGDADLTSRFAVESIPGSQLKSLIDRWGFQGLGIVADPILPTVEFFTLS